GVIDQTGKWIVQPDFLRLLPINRNLLLGIRYTENGQEKSLLRTQDGKPLFTNLSSIHYPGLAPAQGNRQHEYFVIEQKQLTGLIDGQGRQIVPLSENVLSMRPLAKDLW